MIKIEQFIYTAASTNSKKGYQVISKSDGITEKILSEMSRYFLPPDIDSSEFSSSKSLLLLSNHKIAYSNIHNIGIGYDGRPDTLYNHTLVLDLKDFHEIQYDTRYLDSMYLEDPIPKEKLEPIEFFPDSSKLIEHESLTMKSLIKPIFKAIFQKSRIAILDVSDNALIQNIIGLLPTSMRLISFSTLVLDISKQPLYDFIITQNPVKSDLEKKFVIIDPFEFSRTDKKTELDKSIDYIYQIISNHDHEKLHSIYEKFEHIPSTNSKEKLVLLTFSSMLSENRDDVEKNEIVDTVFKTLRSFNSQFSLNYLDSIQDSIPTRMYIESKTEIEISDIEKDLDSYNVSRNSIESLLSKLSKGTSKSWQYLLQKLYSIKKEEFQNNAVSLLFESRHSYYNNEIYKFFVSEHRLHKYLILAFNNESNYSLLEKKSLFEFIIPISIKTNVDLILPLLEKHPFDFENHYDIQSYRQIISTIINSKNFAYDSQFRLKVLSTVYNLLEKTANPDKSSGTLEPTNSVKKELVEIAEVLDSKISEFDEQTLDNETKKLQIQTKIFIIDNKINEPSYSIFSFFRNL